MSNTFSPGDKVIKRNETDPQAWGQVMDWMNRPMYQRPGYLAVYFKRQVWIKPENLLHYSEWLAKHQPEPQSVKDYWTK